MNKKLKESRKKMKKRLISITLALIFILALVPINAVAQDISVEINGQRVIFDGQGPVIVDGRTLVPVRGVFEQLGFDVSWERYLPNTATLRSDTHLVHIQIGSAAFTTNGVSHTLDVPAQIIGGRTMLPIRAVLESVGLSVGWDVGRQTVLVSHDVIAGEVGSIIEFGRYQWRVLDVQGDRMLIISEYIIARRLHQHHDSMQRSSGHRLTWEHTEVRQWLNNEFLTHTHGFTRSDINRISETNVINNDHPWFGNHFPGGSDTVDFHLEYILHRVFNFNLVGVP